MKHHVTHHEWYLYYEHELYTINNMIRLTVVASSIAFFMILSLLDITQVYVTGIYACYHQIKWMMSNPSSNEHANSDNSTPNASEGEDNTKDNNDMKFQQKKMSRA